MIRGIPRKDKQKMYYSLYIDAQVEYKKDSEGNLVYIEVDGEQVPVEIGTLEARYDEPVEITATISGQLNELHAREFGVDQSAIFSEIQCYKNEFPFTYGTRIWKDNDIARKVDGTVDERSADYMVTGLLKDYKDFDWFLLQRQNKENINALQQKILG